ncbi:MAG: molecular chaperone HtpG [Halorhodospira halophila]|uniref:molecular chaperone HtpG n=1 Tax=Halorhodospira TaxID=85108 RepID=UPI001EE988A3|nr:MULTISPECIES: molecular chaperone HtpG [Halorhodospira]MCC3751343.1 molecular chaperone HtpG [Halorhodospira halophila]MCG5527980.1 molecular chaperone HtpG [Halorhodospira halophila]MCG5533308.1 molecular chaperone HtpG [Halorhodospira sp. 9621]MCG5539204.1 molecular chaperone HtpG [Halorhodospira sp. 9622]MCG5542150.1 molecular chaperone HtpG [Halorhodospira sp. 9628]
MSAGTQSETLEFQAEVQQLLSLMIHSVYSNREVFLRELISNASDAIDKLRFEALQQEALYEGDPELKIRVDFDSEARTITVADNGIGMSRDDVIENLGTIAHSGTRRFLEQLTGDQHKDAQLIGQFGVGFYSAFVVADRVEVYTRKAGAPAGEGVRWVSDGQGSYTVDTIERSERGTAVVLHLPEAQQEFCDGMRLRQIIRKYSDHISVPIEMPVPSTASDDDSGEGAEEPGREIVNRASALWMRPKSEVSDEDYRELYKHVAHDFDDPLTWIHNHVEGRQSYVSLLYIPKRPPFDLYEQKPAHGVKLYVRRVFITEDTEHLLPRYLRFVRGVIDSDDLPLNISREMLQHNPMISSLRSASVKRILDRLERMAKNEPEDYAAFWQAFGRVFKEGVAEDPGNRERIARLLRFSSTHEEKETPDVSLDDYVARMKEGQEKIYYVTAESFNAARNSPHLEIFRRHGIEVLLLPDPVDEWLVAHLHEYDGKQLASVAKGELDLEALGEEGDKEAREEKEQACQELCQRLQASLGERVSEVRVSHRLTDSPTCLVVGEYDFGMGMQRLLQAAGHQLPTGKPALEINPDHSVIERLGAESGQRFEDWALTLYEQSLLAEGGQLEDPAAYVRRVNNLLAG